MDNDRPLNRQLGSTTCIRHLVRHKERGKKGERTKNGSVGLKKKKMRDRNLALQTSVW